MADNRYRETERILHAYGYMVDEINDIRESYIEAGGRSGKAYGTMGKGGHSSTENKIIKLVSNRRIIKYQKRVEAIQGVLLQAPGSVKLVAYVKYGIAAHNWQPPARIRKALQAGKMTNREKIMLCGMTERTFYRIKRQLVERVVDELEGGEV